MTQSEIDAALAQIPAQSTPIFVSAGNNRLVKTS